jgi:hypothetical protein
MALPASADNYADETTGVGNAPFPNNGDFSNLSALSMIGREAHTTRPLRAPAVLVADFKEVISDVRTSIHDFLCENIRGSDDNKGSSSRFGFLATERDEVSVAAVRATIERSMDLCESIAGHSGDGTPEWDKVRAQSNQFQLNAQLVLIEMLSMNVDKTIPSGSLVPMMRVLNQMQGVARQTALQLDAVTRAIMS